MTDFVEDEKVEPEVTEEVTKPESVCSEPDIVPIKLDEVTEKLDEASLKHDIENCKYKRDIIENIIDHQEGTLGLNGAVMVDTGRYTGRSPKDKYFVDEESSNKNLWWGPVNAKIDESIFDVASSNIMIFELVIRALARHISCLSPTLKLTPPS